MSNVNTYLDCEENDLNSVVDEFFSFIYNEPVSDDEMDDIRNIRNEGDGGYSLSNNKTVDEVLDKHFSFLRDEPSLDDLDEELFFSLDGHPKTTDLGNGQTATSTYEIQEEDEPIYSNIPTMLSVRPKLKPENSSANNVRKSFDLETASAVPDTVMEFGGHHSGQYCSRNKLESESKLNAIKKVRKPNLNYEARQDASVERDTTVKNISTERNIAIKPIAIENIFQIGNNAVIQITDGNDHLQEKIRGSDTGGESHVKPKVSIENNIRKSSVYLNFDDTSDWRKRQRNVESISEFNPDYNIRVESDGKDPLVFTLFADSISDIETTYKERQTADLQESIRSHDQGSNLDFKVSKFEPRKLSHFIDKPSFDSSKRTSAAIRSKLSKPSSVVEAAVTLDYHQHNTEQKSLDNERAVTNSNHLLTTIERDEPPYSISGEDQISIKTGPSSSSNEYMTKLRTEDNKKENCFVGSSRTIENKENYFILEKDNLLANDQHNIVENIVPYIEVDSRITEQSCSNQSLYNCPTESDRNEFFYNGVELDKLKNKREEKQISYINRRFSDVEITDASVDQKLDYFCGESGDADIMHCPSYKDLERLQSLDMEVSQLENERKDLVFERVQSDYPSTFSNSVTEAINLEVVPSNADEVITSDSALILSSPSSFNSTCLNHGASFSSEDDEVIINIELATGAVKDISMERRKSLVRQNSFDCEEGQRNELILRSQSVGQNTTMEYDDRPSYVARCESDGNSGSIGVQSSISVSEGNSIDGNHGLGSSLSGVVRRSMKRIKHIRLSGRRSKNPKKNTPRFDSSYDSQNVSEETEVRRHFPTIPQVGLPSVRSPTASAVLLPSILAALTPNEPPRETLPSPEEVMDQPRFIVRSNSADYLNNHRTHHRPSSTSHNPENSTHPPRTGTSNSPLDCASVSPTENSSLSPPIEGLTALSTNHESRQRRATNPTAGNRNHRSGNLSNGNRAAPAPPRISNVNSQNSEVSGQIASELPIGRVPVNGTPVPIHGRNTQNSTNVINNTTSANNRRNNRHTRDARDRQRNRPSDNTNNTRRNSNTIITNSNITSNISNNTIVNNNTVSNNNNTPRRTSRTPSRQTSSSHLSSDGDLRQNGDRGRVMRPVAHHPQGFKPPTRTIWPHGHSGLLASLPVTLNMFNISRFAVLGAAFGWQFPIQWFVISLVVALPLMAFHAAIGQAIGGSVIDMWVISPIFQGVGYALLFVELVLGIYCCLPVAWLFTYFRDSFDLRHFRCLSFSDCGTPANLSREINTYVTSFFNNHILQRSDNEGSVMNSLGSVKFDLSFNIALTWVITFLALSRGTRSYGKICYIVYFAPLVCYFSVCFYMMYWANNGLDIKNFGSRFIDRQPWLAASREAFLVWGLHGAVIQQMAASNKKRHPVWRDTTIIAILTVCGLCFASFLGMLCASALESKGLIYRPSSFETENTRAFADIQIHFKDTETILMERNQILGPPQYLRPERVYDNFYAGIRIRDEYQIRIGPRIDSYRSGYNCLRLMTELFPALLFSKDGEFMSAWAPLFYLALLLFGLAQQLSVWHTVVQGVLRLNYQRLVAWETFIAFCCCLFGFSAALPMASGAGINIIYFLDYAIGSVWWIMIIQLIMVFAVLFVRGKPYAAKDVAYKLFGDGQCCATPWIVSPVAFFWTIIVPVGLLILSISSFKNGNYREVFAWASSYWSVLTCQIASTFQLFPLLLVPLVGLIQTCKYLADPRQDLFERIQHLYRPPPQETDEDPFQTSSGDEYDPLQLPYSGSQSPGNEPSTPLPYSDPPPKYTPPPSYSTATGSGFTKLFNRSFRTWRNTLQNQSTVSTDRLEVSSTPTQTTNTPTEPFIPPPDYSHLLAYENMATTTSCSSPPSYATLDPLRMQRELSAYNNAKFRLNLGEFQSQQSASCRYCGVAQLYRLRYRRNSADNVSTEIDRVVDSGQSSSTSNREENGIVPCAVEASADVSGNKLGLAIISSENLDSGVSSNSSGNCSSNSISNRFNIRYHPGEELNNGYGLGTRRGSAQCTNPSCPGPSNSNNTMTNLTRIASYPANPFRRSSSLRRSWTSSLRRSARRIAAAISGTNSARNRYFDVAILVGNSDITAAPSSIDIATQSEA